MPFRYVIASEEVGHNNCVWLIDTQANKTMQVPLCDLPGTRKLLQFIDSTELTELSKPDYEDPYAIIGHLEAMVKLLSDRYYNGNVPNDCSDKDFEDMLNDHQNQIDNLKSLK